MQAQLRTHAVILAAGKGTRMKSELPKVMHPLLGRPMVSYAVRTVTEVTGRRPVVVIGHRGELVRAELGDRASYVTQREQIGTGHALLQAEPLLRDQAEYVLVAFGDMPLISTKTFTTLLQSHQEGAGPVTFLSVIADDPRGFGRVVRGPEGRVQAIVEEAEASLEQLEIRELNVSGYAFSNDWVWEALRAVKPSKKGEYYLTDLVEIAVAQGHAVEAIQMSDPDEAIGINNPEHLVEAENVLLRREGQPAPLEQHGPQSAAER